MNDVHVVSTCSVRCTYSVQMNVVKKTSLVCCLHIRILGYWPKHSYLALFSQFMSQSCGQKWGEVSHRHLNELFKGTPKGTRILSGGAHAHGANLLSHRTQPQNEGDRLPTTT